MSQEQLQATFSLANGFAVSLLWLLDRVKPTQIRFSRNTNAFMLTTSDGKGFTVDNLFGAIDDRSHPTEIVDGVSTGEAVVRILRDYMIPNGLSVIHILDPACAADNLAAVELITGRCTTEFHASFISDAFIVACVSSELSVAQLIFSRFRSLLMPVHDPKLFARYTLYHCYRKRYPPDVTIGRRRDCGFLPGIVPWLVRVFNLEAEDFFCRPVSNELDDELDASSCPPFVFARICSLVAVQKLHSLFPIPRTIQGPVIIIGGKSAKGVDAWLESLYPKK
jgi:hypothetical protein